MTFKKVRELIFRWQECFCSPLGPKSPITRLLLHTLKKHMKPNGTSAWPSQATIAAEAKLDVATVKRHLKIADETGWIRRAVRERRGEKSHRYGTDYRACFPWNFDDAQLRDADDAPLVLPGDPKSEIGRPPPPKQARTTPSLGAVRPTLGAQSPTRASEEHHGVRTGEQQAPQPGQDPGAGSGRAAWEALRPRITAKGKTANKENPPHHDASLQSASPANPIAGGSLNGDAPAMEDAPETAHSSRKRAADVATPDSLDSLENVIARGISLLTTDDSSSTRSADVRIRSSVKRHGRSFIAAWLDLCEQERLRGIEALEALVTSSCAVDKRGNADRDLDRHLAERMIALTGGERRNADYYGDIINQMRDDNGLTRKALWSTWRSAFQNEETRSEASNLILLRHHWQRFEQLATAPLHASARQ